MLFLFVIVYNLIFSGEPIKVHITRHRAVPQWLWIHAFKCMEAKKLPKCGFEIGGKHEPKQKKLKSDTDSPSCVLIVESSQLKLYSVQINSKHNRVFVVQWNSDFVCHSEKCKEKRAAHVASEIPFSCEHCNLLKSFSSPTLAKNLHEDDIKNYKCDNTTQRMLIDAIQPPDDFRHVVEISESCYAVYHGASQGPSNPTGYCHLQKRDGLFRCKNKSCAKKKWQQ